MIRVIVPDSHGSRIDKAAAKAFLTDLKNLNPEEIVCLGDHVDVDGIFSKHPRKCQEDLEYSYFNDLKAGNWFFDEIQARAPRAQIHYLEGNHEYRVERWAAENISNRHDVKMFIEGNSPQYKLHLKERGIKFYRQMEFYQGISIRNTIRLGHCYFTHGICHSKHATAKHVERFGSNIVHGHTHRVAEFKTRTVRSDAIGGWCPGTLMELQPTYRHTEPTDWSHGYGVQFVEPNGKFLHVNVPIIKGKSYLPEEFRIKEAELRGKTPSAPKKSKK